MQMNDLIVKKRDGYALTTEEIQWMIRGFTDGSVPDYQMSAMAMAIYFQGMDRRETLDLTLAMLHSGDTIDLSGVSGVKADKHSTGGVGDKTSLVLVPMMAACGVKMAKMSGRGLGHTGGTIDKLESFPGFDTALTMEQFFHNVETVGMVISGQSANLDPADKKLYALRDVTGTVPSIPLIASSIMSKKLAAGADVIVLDVKCGAGSFMRTPEQAKALATEMVEIGKGAGRNTVAVITDMDEPLGYAVGNALEVREAIDALNGAEPGELMELCYTLGSAMLTAGGIAADDASARAMMKESIQSGAALNKLKTLIESQGGDASAVEQPDLLPTAPVQVEATSKVEGYVNRIDAADVGVVSMHLGGGRATKESEIDLRVGLVLHKKVGDYVNLGESLATIHAADEASGREAVMLLRGCYHIEKDPPEKTPFIKGIVR